VSRPHLRLIEPLPECGLCDRPTARRVWEATKGLCSECDEGVRAVARQMGARLPPAPDELWYDE
jgi:hypothetical protein